MDGIVVSVINHVQTPIFQVFDIANRDLVIEANGRIDGGGRLSQSPFDSLFHSCAIRRFISLVCIVVCFLALA
jgi:hypothetical protein